MRTVGIIGGLGPETTASFYLDILSKCYERTQEQRPPILIWNIPLKYEIEREFIENARGEEEYIPYLVEGARILEAAGANFLVIPCVTVHMFIGEVRRAVQLPVLSIVKETADRLKRLNISAVGLLATTMTVEQNIFSNVFKINGIEQIVPNEHDQERLGKIINRILGNNHSPEDKNQLLRILQDFRMHQVNHILLGCTDLQILIKPEDSELTIHDTMDILATATVREILDQS